MPFDESLNIPEILAKKGSAAFDSVNYLTIVKAHYRELIEKVIKSINASLTKTVGKEEAIQVMSLISNGTIDIANPEGWKQGLRPTHDPSIELYNQCKSFDDFFFHFISYIKNIELYCYKNIVIRDFFFVVADMLSGENPPINIDILKPYFNMLVCSCSFLKENSNYHFHIVDQKLLRAASRATGLNLTFYPDILRLLFSCIKQQKETTLYEKAPIVSILISVSESCRYKQQNLLADFFDTPIEDIEDLTKDIIDLGASSPRVRTLLKYLTTKTGKGTVNGVLTKLKELSASLKLRACATYNSVEDILEGYEITEKIGNKRSLKRIYVNEELFANSFKPYILEFIVKHTGAKVLEVMRFLDSVKSIATAHTAYMKRIYRNMQNKRMKDVPQHAYKITLTNISFFTRDFISQIKKKIKAIESMSCGKFILEVQYRESTLKRKSPPVDTGYIRVISDVHADYNRDNMYVFDFADDFVINCGDTAGDAKTEALWNLQNIKKGVVVPGNHLGYSYQFYDTNSEVNENMNTKEGQLKLYKETLENSPIQFLNNSCTMYKGVVIIGSCLYSDFNIYGEKHREECMQHAERSMNDFHRIITTSPMKTYENGKWKVLEETKEIRPFTPIDHAYLFWQSFNYIKGKVLENKNKPIIIVTHFAPSTHSVAKKYKGDLLNGAFTSNLNQFIIENPNIRLWCFGHTHSKFDYILGETRMVCEPLGYNNENNAQLPFNYGLRIPVWQIKSKESWKTLLQDKKNSSIKVYND